MHEIFAPTWKKIAQTIYSFSPREKKVFISFLIIFAASSLGLLWKLNQTFLVTIPARGGSLSEGVIGAPRFINPLLAISDADRDLTELVYSGLMRAMPGGELVYDLAQEYTVSEDGLVYTFNLKEDVTWHDGEPITSEDIAFTIARVKDSVLKSPKRASWEGVEVKKIGEKTIQFILRQSYSPFLENTTLGILPSHLWKDINSEQFGFSTFNIEPVGAGPYKIKNIKKDSSGIPKYYELIPFKHFALGRPYIETLVIHFYANEEELFRAFQKGEVEAINAIPPLKAQELSVRGTRIETSTLPRVFGVFFNQNQNTVFTNHVVRAALQEAIDREEIVQEVLFGYGTALRGPLPPGSLGFSPQLIREEVDIDTEDDQELENLTHTQRAQNILEEAGWKLNKETGIREIKTKKGTQTLEFSLATGDTEELKNTVSYLKNTWEAIGARVNLQIFSVGELNQNVIRPRKYDALFFGEIVGRESDPFAFWHSSQRNDPGLNIALYTNITVDSLLEEGRIISNIEERIRIYKQFQEEIAKDVPAVFVYAPEFIYAIPSKIKGLKTGTLTTPSERFLDIHTWYIETDKVWRIFQ